ncbi:MAG: hypothetical protein EOR60_09820 [Mesorhizobium sp.]|nr:MAG: hypothetical protein EOR60_09820 [Mesorhizobium sp.]
MADSDNSMSLAHVTRSRLLPGTPTTTAGTQLTAGSDPAVAVWRDWQEAHFETERLCNEQQRLENKLIKTVGLPRATIHLRDGKSVTLHSLEALHEVRDLGQVDEVTHSKAQADLAVHQTRWDSADQDVGYTAALRAEAEAAARAEALLCLLSKTPANSLAGIAAKLDAVLREGQTSAKDDELPWPQIRSALNDIARLGNG